MFEEFSKILDGNAPQKCELRESSARGAAYLIAGWCFDEYFNYIADHEYYNKYEELEIIDDIIDAWAEVDFPREYGIDEGGFISVFGDFDFNDICNFVDDVLERTYEPENFPNEDPDYAITLLVKKCDFYLHRVIDGCRHDIRIYNAVRDFYSKEIGDRIIHDRQISAYIAGQLTNLFYKDGVFIRDRVKRIKFPSFVREILYSRDRHKCTICKCDIGTELLAEANIDHIHPLALGGCNDVVNLQLVCKECNLNKAANRRNASSSIPKYHAAAARYRRRGVRGTRY